MATIEERLTQMQDDLKTLAHHFNMDDDCNLATETQGVLQVLNGLANSPSDYGAGEDNWPTDHPQQRPKPRG